MASEAWTFLPLGGAGGWMLVDAGDVAQVERRSWCRHSGGYVEARIKGRVVYLHRLLMRLWPGMRLEVDHRNGDRSDCRRCNMRITTRVGNAWNRAAIEHRGASRFRGVARSGRRWRAYCSPGGKQIHLGTFDTEDEAARRVQAWRHEQGIEATR